MDKHIIRIHCQDQTGLVYKATKAFYDQGLNIINNGEHVDQGAERFFMRTEVEGPLDRVPLEQTLRKDLPQDMDLQITANRRKRLVVMVTKEHHCIGDLLIRCAYNEMNADIAAVIGNHSTLHPLVEKFEIPFVHISHKGLPRETQEQKILETVDDFHPDYIVLAKYMRILTPTFVAAYANRIINIHHSFLPAFIGAKPYQQAYDRGVKIVGATAHFVNDDLDEGPILSQSIIPVTHAHSAEDMAKSGQDVEKITLATALKIVLEDRFFVYNNKTIIFE